MTKQITDVEYVETGTQQVITKEGKVIPPVDVKLEHDFQVARDNLHNLIEQASDAIEDALAIARSSELSKDWEQYTHLLDVVANLNLRLLELNEKYKKLLPKQAAEDIKQNSTVNNNAIFVGTTDELLKLIKRNK